MARHIVRDSAEGPALLGKSPADLAGARVFEPGKRFLQAHLPPAKHDLLYRKGLDWTLHQ